MQNSLAEANLFTVVKVGGFSNHASLVILDSSGWREWGWVGGGGGGNKKKKPVGTAILAILACVAAKGMASNSLV